MADALSWLQQMLGGGQVEQPAQPGGGIGALFDRISGSPTIQGMRAPNAGAIDLSAATGLPPAMDASLGQGTMEQPVGLREGIDARVAGAPLFGVGGIRAWHASPYDFDRFDLSKVGTGQGAASYGHGIYAAESPRVSGPGGSYDLEFTAKNLGKYDLNQGEADVLRVLRAGGSDLDALGSLARGGGYTFDEAAKVLDRVKAAKAKLYEVDINAEPGQFLNWDKPAAQQPEAVKGALGQIWQRLGGTLEGRQNPPFAAHGESRGENLYSALATSISDIGRQTGGDTAAASQALREAGIPGVRYLDQGSRVPLAPATYAESLTPQQQMGLDALNASGQAGRWQRDPQTLLKDLIANYQDSADALARGNKAVMPDVGEKLAAMQSLDPSKIVGPKQTYNYVMFDDKLIDIRRKLGLLPPLAAGAAAGGGLLASEPPT